MLLEHKKAVIYGAAEAIGVPLPVRSPTKTPISSSPVAPGRGSIADEISAAGGVAEAAEVDALDEDAIEKHMGPRPRSSWRRIVPAR